MNPKLTFTFAFHKTGWIWNGAFFLTGDTRRTDCRIQRVAVRHEDTVVLVRVEGHPGTGFIFLTFFEAIKFVNGVCCIKKIAVNAFA